MRNFVTPASFLYHFQVKWWVMCMCVLYILVLRQNNLLIFRPFFGGGGMSVMDVYHHIFMKIKIFIGESQMVWKMSIYSSYTYPFFHSSRVSLPISLSWNIFLFDVWHVSFIDDIPNKTVSSFTVLFVCVQFTPSRLL